MMTNSQTVPSLPYSSDKGRIAYLDVAKAICMISVMAGHYIPLAMVNRVIYIYHLPLFLILAGYFFNPSKNSVRRIACNYLVPFYLTAFVKYLYTAIQSGARGGYPSFFATAKNGLLDTIYASTWLKNSAIHTLFPVNNIGAIWFLIALAGAECLLLFLFRMENESRRWILLYLLAGIAYAIGKYVWLPFALCLIPVVAIWLLLGYELRKRSFFSVTFPLHIKLIFIFVWLSSYLCVDHIDMCRNHYPLLFLDIFASFAASYCIVLVAKLIDKLFWIGCSLRYIGQRTLCVLCVHEIDRYCFRWECNYPVNYWLICAILISILRIGVELCVAILIANLVVAVKKSFNTALYKNKLFQVSYR